MNDISEQQIAQRSAKSVQTLTTAGPAPRLHTEDALRAWYRALGLAEPRIILWATSPLAAQPLLAAVTASVAASGNSADELNIVAAWEAASRVGHSLPAETLERIAAFGMEAWDRSVDSIRSDYRAAAEPTRHALIDVLGDHQYDHLIERLYDRCGAVRANAVIMTGETLDWYASLDAERVNLRPLAMRWFSPELIDLCLDAGIEAAEPWADWSTLVDGVFTLWPFRGGAILCERPSEIVVDPQGRPHNESGPALRWGSEYEIYAWHGTVVPRSLIESAWPVRSILHTRNAEVRRCAIERIGWDAFLEESGCFRIGNSVPDPGNPGFDLTLYDVPAAYLGEHARVLLCTNASRERDGTRRRYGLLVPPLISDPISAAAWTFNLSPYDYLTLTAAT